jgi:hypothetical protein
MIRLLAALSSAVVEKTIGNEVRPKYEGRGRRWGDSMCIEAGEVLDNKQRWGE